MIKIGLLGGSGRMGQLIAQKILGNPKIHLSAIGIHHQKPIGLDLSNILMTTNPEDVFNHSDIVIDFTKPEALQKHVKAALITKKPLVIGTTGLTDADQALFKEAARHLAILYAPNMSLGLTLMLKLTEHIASLLDSSFDIEILEMHHRYKTDAPSGTALALGKAAAKGRNTSFQEKACFDRINRQTSRPENEIGFAILRGGNVAGDHQVIFTSDEEILTLSHHALDRSIFANGAIKAALWLVEKKPGLYSMHEVAGLPCEISRIWSKDKPDCGKI